jgi:hypothetical protein
MLTTEALISEFQEDNKPGPAAWACRNLNATKKHKGTNGN